jgi:FkbM family methyltransferase
MKFTVNIHHIGGRGFGTSFDDCPKTFDANIHYYLYEGDKECADAMKNENERKNYTILPHCLGAEKSKKKLNITKNPFGSSLYQPNSYYENYYGEVNTGKTVYDAIFGQWCKKIRDVDVEVNSLDNLFQSGALVATAQPDFLSVDTQGSEFDIFKGAAKTIENGVLGIVSEIEFHPLYKDQPLFSHVFDELHSLKFHFAGFTHISDEISSFRAPLGQRGKGFLAFGDALFLRRLESLSDFTQDKSELFVAAYKLAFISITFGYVEYGLEALNYAEEMLSSIEEPPEVKEILYFQFLKDLKAASQKMDDIKLKVEPTPEKTQAQDARENSLAISKLVQLKKAVVISISREFKVFYNALDLYVSALPRRRVRQSIFSNPLEAIIRIFCYALRYAHGIIYKHDHRSPFHPHFTMFEDVLEKYDFFWVSAIVRRRRLEAVRHMSKEDVDALHRNESS